jgi:hypothetical protein
MAAEQYRLTPEQVDAAEAVLDLGEDGKPGGTRAPGRSEAVVLRECPTHDVIVNLHGDALIAETGVTATVTR